MNDTFDGDLFIKNLACLSLYGDMMSVYSSGVALPMVVPRSPRQHTGVSAATLMVS